MEFFFKHLTDCFIIFFHGIPWKIQWNSMEFNAFPWISMENGIPLNSIEFYESEVDGIPWNCVN
jgi:hypothetical protein